MADDDEAEMRAMRKSAAYTHHATVFGKVAIISININLFIYISKLFYHNYSKVLHVVFF